MSLKKLRYSFADWLEVFTGKRNSMIPPARIVNINSGDSELIGKTFLNHFIDLGGLKQTDDVLDVGSGFGRMAVPLTQFLHGESNYEGLEILPRGVEWCSKKITRKFENFKFTKIDVKNGRYNPKGTFSASEYRFPFENDSFDFVILTSVFTHLLTADMENYLKEISRILKKGGRSLITFFILNEESKKLIEEGKSTFELKFGHDGCRIESKEDPEYVVAYPEDLIKSLYKEQSMIIKPIHYGNWCGRTQYTDFQDIVVAEKA